MTTENAPSTPTEVTQEPLAGSARKSLGKASRRLLPGSILAIVLLALSAGVRYQMEAAVAQRISSTRFSPFALSEIPLDLGPWKGKEDELDPYIAQKTGSTDYIMRRYTNDQTGTILDVLMLYGPAAAMGYHSPLACYPNAGFSLVGGGDMRPITFDFESKPKSVSFRHLVYKRGEGGIAERQQVYYVWRYSDTYAVDLGQPSMFGRLPGMFKIQVSRNLATTETADGRANSNNPCEDFLTRLMPIFESRVQGSGHSQATVAPNTSETKDSDPSR